MNGGTDGAAFGIYDGHAEGGMRRCIRCRGAFRAGVSKCARFALENQRSLVQPMRQARRGGLVIGMGIT